MLEVLEQSVVDGVELVPIEQPIGRGGEGGDGREGEDLTHVHVEDTRTSASMFLMLLHLSGGASMKRRGGGKEERKCEEGRKRKRTKKRRGEKTSGEEKKTHSMENRTHDLRGCHCTHVLYIPTYITNCHELSVALRSLQQLARITSPQIE